LPAATQQRLKDANPFGSMTNPVDVTAQALNNLALVGGPVRAMLTEGGYDAVVAFFMNWLSSPVTGPKLRTILAEALVGLEDRTLALAASGPASIIREYERQGFLVFDDPARAVATLGAMARIGAALRTPLTAREKDIVVNNLQADRQNVDSADHSTLRQAFRDPIVYVLAIAYIAVIAGTSTVALWAPTVLRGLGVAPSMIGILTGAPFILAVAAMYLLGLSSDRMLERRWHYAGAISAAGASLILLGLGTGNVILTVALIAVAAAGAWASLPVFWTIPPAYLSGTARAGGIAFISSIGAIGGFISPTIVGGITSLTGSLYYGLAGVGAMLILSAVILLLGIQSKTIHERKVELQSATA
jgi:hypothetical protein